MKSIKYILASALTLVLALGFSSCKDDDDFTLAEQLTNAQVYFPGQSNSKTVSLSPGENTFTIDIVRRNASEALTVPLNVSGEDAEMFSVPASVNFAANQSSTSFEVKLATAEETFGYDTKHSFDLKIGNDSYTTPYGVDELAVTAVIAAPWVTLGTATYRDDFLSTFWATGTPEYEVEIQENQLQPGLFRLVNPYGAAYPYNEDGDWDASQDYYIEIHAEDPDAVYISMQNTGLDWGYGDLYINSFAGYYLAKGLTVDEVKENGVFGTYKDGVITFPANSLMVGMVDYNDLGLYRANTNGGFRVVMPGVVLADYSLEIGYAGKYTDSDDNVAGAIVNLLSAGSDVETIKYAIVAGTDVDAAVAGIIDGSIQTLEASPSQTTIMVPFSEAPVAGKYTIVAVSYGNGEAQEVSSATFKYTSAAAETWSLVGTGDYTYTLFFGSDEEPAVDEGLELYQSDSDATRYKIEHWGYDVDFFFNFNASTGEVLVDENETGYVHPSYGTVEVIDIVSYVGDSSYGQSSYSNGTFTFGLVYFCSAGMFNYGEETFTLNDAASAKSHKVARHHGAKKIKGNGPSLSHKRLLNAMNLKRLK